MPKLTNAKHERFCQLVSQGHAQGDAYRSVFETDNPKTASANASRLRSRPEVQARISELEGQLQRGAIEGAGVDRESVLRGLTENLARAVKANNLPAANRALELLGKSLGLFIERFDTGPNLDHVLDGMSSEQIHQYLRSMIHDLGMLPIDHSDDELREYVLRKREKLVSLGVEVREVEPPKPDAAEPDEAHSTRPH